MVGVTVIGDLMLDRYWHCEAAKLNPEVPGVVWRYERTSSSLGGAAAVAGILAGMGATVAVVGRVGRDLEGGELASELEQVCDSVSINREGRTTTKQRMIVGGQLLGNRFDFESPGPQPGDVQAIEAGTWHRAVIVSDYGKGFISRESWLVARDYWAGRFVLVDPACGRSFDEYAGASCVKMNALEAHRLCGLEPEAAAELLARRHDLAVIVTDGPRGMWFCEGGRKLYQPAAAAVRMRDVTGAGDTVAAAIAAARAEGLDWPQCLDRAARLAARQVEQLGVAPVRDTA